MQYLFNSRNHLVGQPVTATNIVPSNVIERTDRDEKQGGGVVSVTGDFNAQDDVTFDFEILNSASTTPRVSEPVFSGVGNGTLDDLDVTGVDSQQITVSLEKLGTRTFHASVPYRDGFLFARNPGEDGNDLVLTVDDSALTTAATNFATQEDIRVGTNEYTGEHWNFDTPDLTVDGKVPADAPRIQFGFDPQVYRAYRRYIAGRYVYGFSPAPVRDVPSGTIVYAVTGARVVTITDGDDTDELEDIVTEYDFLRAVGSQDDASAATTVYYSGVYGEDFLPGGQAAVEFSLFTRPYLTALERDGTAAVEQADIGLVVGADATTSRTVFSARDVTVPGAEVWSGRNDVLGALPDAITGVPYNAGGLAFTIPVPPPQPAATQSSITAELDTVDDRPRVTLCVEDAIVGQFAQAKRYTFIYGPAVADCNCDGANIEGGPNPIYLGVTPDQEDTDMALIPAPLQAPLQDLYDWQSTFISANTALLARDTAITEEGTPSGDSSDATSGQVLADALLPGTVDSIDASRSRRYELVSAVLKADRVDVNAAKGAVAIFHQALRTIYDTLDPHDVPGPAQTEWDAALVDLASDFSVIDGNVGADFWRKASTYYTVDIGDTASGTPELAQALIANATQVLTNEFTLYLERYRARMAKVLVLAGVEPPFADATLTDAVWRDHGGPRFYSQDGLLPLFLKHYYHSARDISTDPRQIVPEATKEFGIGVDYACGSPKFGDRLYIDTDVTGAVRSVYQVSDEIGIQTTRASPISFTGGQTGDNLLTFSVIGSVDGRFASYVLNLASPAPYSDGGLSFGITEGTIAFALRDGWTLSVESAQFKWRKNGGAWSDPIDIPATTFTLSDGCVATFSPGLAPSWVAGDAWAHLARAVNGPANMLTPADGRCTWTGSTSIVLPPSTPGVVGLYIGDHTIPSTATITLQGSDDNFSTTPLNVPIPWRARDIWYPFTASRAKYRLQIDAAGSIAYLWLSDEPFECLMRNGLADLGRFTKRIRMSSIEQRRAISGTVEHEGMTLDAFDNFASLIDIACQNDRRRFAIVPRETSPESSLVRYTPESLEARDLFGLQPINGDLSFISCSLELEAVP